ncbi:MAG: 16S rRNA (cytosine(1402)-N(4))-methyltransferase [Gammaproteobacteria bacterium]|nr:MAG: 16S rRNA (cytosine(1402)-N(4))-methyltransferase [Gammaproteobacteria bacterium]
MNRVTEEEHRPVLKDSVIELLGIESNGRYVDATYGRGGHAQGILGRLGPQGRLMVIDRDSDAIDAAKRLHGDDERVVIRHGAFSRLDEFVAEEGWSGAVDGVLFDLGVSSPQLDTPSRGFSFMNDGPLDMRMDIRSGQSAAQWLAEADEKEIAGIIFEYGEERFSRRIARNIVRQREQQPLLSTSELAELVKRSVPPRHDGKHPATKTFQAIRIHVNDELRQIRSALASAFDALTSGGRLAVISFHSLEDRIVKQFMTRLVKGESLPAYIPVTGKQSGIKARWVAKRVKPGAAEIESNPRARSSVLRVVEAL